MAEKRMFSKEIIDSDAFLDMPTSSQNLYFHLGMRADDDGFINSPNKIMSICKASKNDMDLLIVKNFVIPFESGVVVIKHWRINNYLRADRYKPTNYQEEKAQLIIKDNESYQRIDDSGIPMVDHRLTQNRIEEISIDKDRKEESRTLPSPKTKKSFAIDSVLIDMVNASDLTEDVKKSLLGWLAYKAERREKYTERGFNSLITIIKKKCSSYGDKIIIDLIEECQSNGYQGIIWDKLVQRFKGQTQQKPSKPAEPNKYVREE